MIIAFLNDDFNSIERYMAEAVKPYVEANKQDWITEMINVFDIINKH